MTAPDSRPSILFVFSDQQRWDTMGCYGQRLNITPNLDQLAAEGVRFDRAFTCQPVCGPARSCLQTGRYATEIGCFRNHIALPQDERTIAHEMADSDYSLAYVGKWHLASSGGKVGQQQIPEQNYRTVATPPERRGGWNEFWMAADTLESTSHGYDGFMFDAEMNKVEFKGYRADCQTDFALQYLRSREGQSQPFFMFLSYIEPHHQNDHNRFEGPEGSKQRFADFDVPGDLRGTDGDWRENYPDYLGCCASLDANFGRIRQELQRQGILDNTLIIYTSDHGCHFRTRNGEYKRSCHDSCLRIPMIIRGPGFTGGKVVEQLVSLIDLPPTVLTAGGRQPLPTMQGRPLQALACGEAPADWPDDVFVQISESHVGRAIRTHRWTYSVRAPELSGVDYPDSDLYAEDYLYDNLADPHQKNNLVADPALADVRTELAARLIKRMTEAGETPPQIVPAS